jgi:hypothetical protein
MASRGNVIVVLSGESIAAGIAAAVAAGASWANPVYIQPVGNVLIDYPFDPFSLQPLKADGTVAEGVFILGVDPRMGLDDYPPMVLQEPLLAIRCDDGRADMVRLAQGTVVWSAKAGDSVAWVKDGVTDEGLNTFTDVAGASYLVDKFPCPTPAASAICTKWEKLIFTSIDAGRLGHRNSLTSVDIATIKAVQSKLYMSFLLVNGAYTDLLSGIQIGICSESTFAATDDATVEWYDVPAVVSAYGGKHRVLLDISATSLAAIQSIGVKYAAGIGNGYVGIGDVRVAAHPFIGISPLSYAAKNLAAVTAAIPPALISSAAEWDGTGIDEMNWNDLYQTAMHRGVEIANHDSDASGTITDPEELLAAYREYQIGGKYRLEGMDISTGMSPASTRFYPTKPGFFVNGHVENGDAWATSFRVGANLEGPYAPVARQHYKWQAGISVLKPGDGARPKWGGLTTYYNTDIDYLTAQLASDGTMQNAIIMLHYISETGYNASTAPSHISYVQWHKFVDAIKAAADAGRVTPVCLSTFYSAPTIGHNATISPWRYAREGSVEASTVTNGTTLAWKLQPGSGASAAINSGGGESGGECVRLTAASATRCHLSSPNLYLGPGRWAIKARVKSSVAGLVVIPRYRITYQDSAINTEIVAHHNDGYMLHTETIGTDYQDVIVSVTVPVNAALESIWYECHLTAGATLDFDNMQYRPL